ncbi:ribonucleotide reductase, alpha subunit [Pseudomonas saudiphocaensis]|uniref:Ribonucleotide reductase, alpha subunit n=2 Tax=Pseudomonas saudiphocaensis TaxID=1499686 RepID=A0A078LXD6_9PSED|nr:ribonucleotide reductase, alpha subunit [Pseudomonas saudiphocaensis]
MADGSFIRQVLSSGATTGSTYLTFKDNKLVTDAREDASSFVASDGVIRGPYLEAMLQQLRSEQPDLQASDLELARAVLAAEY